MINTSPRSNYLFNNHSSNNDLMNRICTYTPLNNDRVNQSVSHDVSLLKSSICILLIYTYFFF